MRTNKNIIGRFCVVRDLKTGNTIVEALIIDQITDHAKAKRVRLQSGEHFGEVRGLGEYQFIEYVAPGEAPPTLAMAVGETNG